LRAIKGAFGHNGIRGPETVRYLLPEPADAPPAQPDATASTGTDSDDACGDTSVNRDIDAQLAAAQRATDQRNLLDTDATPNDSDTAARTA
jgi:hypothetical protein